MIFLLFLLKNIHCGYSSTYNLFRAKIRKNSLFSSEIVISTVVKIAVYCKSLLK